jgi:leucyl/phenylalanyl-tRNA---protein transferase
MPSTLTCDQLLAAYAGGYFPMADSRNARELYWYCPEKRGVLPLESFHVPRSLEKFLRHCPYEVTADKAFEQVIRACADARTRQREDTWINDEIIALYCELAQRGHAHSVECWQEGMLAGGLYGVSLGGAFFGESMFSLAVNASKVALVNLVERLKRAGYELLDTQYVNDHLLQFGVIEINRADYLQALTKALKASPNPSARFLTASDIRS